MPETIRGFVTIDDRSTTGARIQSTLDDSWAGNRRTDLDRGSSNRSSLKLRPSPVAIDFIAIGRKFIELRKTRYRCRKVAVVVGSTRPTPFPVTLIGIRGHRSVGDGGSSAVTGLGRGRQHNFHVKAIATGIQTLASARDLRFDRQLRCS